MSNLFQRMAELILTRQNVLHTYLLRVKGVIQTHIEMELLNHVSFFYMSSRRGSSEAMTVNAWGKYCP